MDLQVLCITHLGWMTACISMKFQLKTTLIFVQCNAVSCIFGDCSVLYLFLTTISFDYVFFEFTHFPTQAYRTHL